MLNPSESIRALCRNCLGNSKLFDNLVRNCEGNTINCAFYPYRFGSRASLRVIRNYCIHDCMAGNQQYVADCTTTECSAFPYRFAHNPKLKGKGASKETMDKIRLLKG